MHQKASILEYTTIKYTSVLQSTVQLYSVLSVQLYIIQSVLQNTKYTTIQWVYNFTVNSVQYTDYRVYTTIQYTSNNYTALYSYTVYRVTTITAIQ